MPTPVSRRLTHRQAIIAALLMATCLLSACGMAIRFGYNQADALVFRWLDGYVDFDDAQSLRVRTALDETLAWHRRTQLSDYADLLAKARAEVAENTTPERVCAWGRDFRVRADALFDHVRPVVIDVALSIKPQQIANIEKRNAERNAEYRSDFLQRDPAKRRSESIRRTTDLAEQLYGSLGDVQRDYIARAVADSPYDADLSYAERVRRQDDALAIFRRFAAKRVSRADADAEVRGYVQRIDRSPRDDYRRDAEKLADYNCSFGASLHNLTTPEQRRAAAKNLKGYEDDMRALAADTG